MADIYNPNQDIHIDKTTSKIVVKKQQDVNPILEDNKMIIPFQNEEERINWKYYTY